jgi:hypothetical protein
MTPPHPSGRGGQPYHSQGTVLHPSQWKGTVPQDFRAGFFFTDKFPLKPLIIPLSHIYRRCRWYRWQVATVVLDTYGKLALVSLTPVENLPPVLTTPLNLTPVYLDLRISPQIFEKIWNDPDAILRGLGEDDSWKISWHCPVKVYWFDYSLRLFVILLRKTPVWIDLGIWP